MYTRGVHISRAVTHQVHPALQSLTSVFGMGTGISSALWPRENSLSVCYRIGKNTLKAS
jgi:hypothetical protein